MAGTTTPTLADFLLARIAEDEMVARSTADHPTAPWGGEALGAHWVCRDESFVLATESRHELWDTQGWNVGSLAADHIARWDPARVLAECEAKRRIVEAWLADESGPLGKWDDYAWHAIGWAMRALALPYAEHPDYREGWRP